MKHSARLHNYFYLLIVFAASNTASYSVRNCILNGSKLSLCAGPTWLEAYYYFSLLREEKPAAFTPGNQNTVFVQEILKKHDLLQRRPIHIDSVKSDRQDFVHSALSCSANTLSINTPLFNKLSDQEKEAIIVHAALRIEKNHIRTHALALTCIPIFTELVLKLCAYGTSQIRKPEIREAVVTAGSYSPTCITKLVLNTFLTHSYFKYQAKRADSAAVQKLKNSSALASFYTKMHTLIKQKSLLLSLRQPTLESRLGYLVS